MTESSPLAWGRRYLMVSPDHFRVDYAINPFMDPADQPDPGRTRAQFEAIVGSIEVAGGTVDVLPQRADAPDMVYAMNLGLFLEADDADRVVLSHMRFPQRRMETESAHAWAAGRGLRHTYLGRDGVGAHFEAGDAFRLVRRAAGRLRPAHRGARAQAPRCLELGVTVRGFRITHSGMYHMDLSFLPLDDRRALVCPAAYDEPSAAALLALVPEPLC